jgi:hypothetical protein
MGFFQREIENMGRFIKHYFVNFSKNSRSGYIHQKDYMEALKKRFWKISENRIFYDI